MTDTPYNLMKAKIDNSDYTTKVLDPDYHGNKPRLSINPTPDQVRKYADDLETYNTLIGNDIKVARAAYRNDIRRLEREVFKADLADAYGVSNHPKADRVFELSWDRGHSVGLGDVLIEYDDLVELIKD